MNCSPVDNFGLYQSTEDTPHSAWAVLQPQRVNRETNPCVMFCCRHHVDPVLRNRHVALHASEPLSDLPDHRATALQNYRLHCRSVKF